MSLFDIFKGGDVLGKLQSMAGQSGQQFGQQPGGMSGNGRYGQPQQYDQQYVQQYDQQYAQPYDQYGRPVNPGAGQGAGMMGAGALGALMGAMLSGGSRSGAQNAALVGAGALAWNFYKKWSAQKQAEADAQAQAQYEQQQYQAQARRGRQPFQQNGGFGDPGYQNAQYQQPYGQYAEEENCTVEEADDNALRNAGFASGRQQANAMDPAAVILLRSMIYAARADGHIDPEEQERIGRMAGQMFPGQDMSQLVNVLLNERIDPYQIASQVVSQEQAEDVYRVSSIIIDIDEMSERSYMDALAEAMGIDAGTKDAIEQEAAGVKRQLAQMRF